MSERELPDDPSLWPANPYELLGVGYGVDARAARRAYLSLIRRFKPEHAPEQFKQIRAAYEFIERQIKAREAQAAEEAEEAGAAESDDWGLEPLDDEAEEAPFTAEVAEPSLASPAAPRGVPLFAPDPAAQCEEVWRELCAGGKPADAFARLRNIHAQPGGAVEACLRLYWLAVAAPEVDLGRDPCHWLIEGLRQGRLDGRLRELYRRELEANPQEATRERCGALLQLDAPPGALADLVEWRWNALARLGRLDLLLADLPLLRQRIAFDEEATWGRLLLAAIDQLAWSDDPPAQQAAIACRQELDALNHLHETLARDLDRLDLLWEVAAGWRRLGAAISVPRAWVELIPVSWTRDYPSIRAKLLPVLQEIARDPLRGLGVMDEMARHSGAAVAQLGFTIDAFRYAEERYEHDSRSDLDRAALVGLFLRTNDCSNYRAVRRQLLKFCLIEVIEPIVFAQTADELLRHLAGSGSWQDQVAEDGPLRYIYSAVRAFGS